jgi:hypothetical protein
VTEIISHNSIIEEILNEWKDSLNRDYLAYRGHVYRVFNLCQALYPGISPQIIDKIAIAVSFHDLGIWSDRTFDYLGPSVNRAKEYLDRSNSDSCVEEVSLIIKMHHKFTSYQGNYQDTVEVLRRADLIDLSFGLISFGVSKRLIAQLNQQFPNNGFHKRLVGLSLNHVLKHPLQPFPMLRF